MGQAAGVAVDAQDHVWIIQRPRTLTDDEKALTLNPPPSKCCRPAPAVMEFDAEGTLIKAWGGAGQGFEWPQNEHGISIDGRAFGKMTTDEKLAAYSPSAAPSQQFGNPVHCVRIAKDGLVYVCDRANDRIQVFRKDGSFVTEFIIEKSTLRAGSVWDLDFWIDPKQTYLLNADGMNNEVRTLRRETGEIVGAFGRNGRNAGEFHWVHNLAVDSKGNIFTTEVDTGKRAQKFRSVGPAVR